MRQTVDVVIPVYQPDEKYARLLKGLAGQTYPVEHIYVMNTGEAYYRASEYPAPENITVKHLTSAEFDHGGTRDRAARMGSSDLVLFLTQDAVPADRNLVENLVRCFADPQVGAAYARQLPAPDCGAIERYTRQFNYPPESRKKTKADLEELGIKTYFCSNVCAMYRRDVYQELGGFPVKTIFNEDMIFAASVIQSGRAVVYAADARVVHSHNYSGLQQFHRNFDMAVSQADHPEIFAGLKSEGEGMRLVKKTAGWLLGHKPWLLPQLIWVSGWKYFGYLLGKRYRKLPKKAVLWCSMNSRYWK